MPSYRHCLTAAAALFPIAAALPCQAELVRDAAALRNATAAQADNEVVFIPEAAREPVLLAAHHAYTLWSQQFLAGAILEDEQTEAWRSFLGMDVRMGEAYRQMGATAYQEGRFEDAVKMLTVAVDFLDEDASLLGELGYSQKTIGHYEQAVANLTKATSLDGARSDLWIWLGDAQRLVGNYEEAYRSLLTARDVVAAEFTADVDNFIEYTQKLNDLTPSWDNFEQHRDFAKRHEETGRALRLIAEYALALRVAPQPAEDDKENLYRIGWVQMQMGTQYAFIKQPALAIDYFEQAIATYTQSKSDADLMRVYQNVALACEQLAERYPKNRVEHLEKAAKNWESALSMATSAGEPAYMRHTQGGLLATLAAIRPKDDPRIVELRAALEKEIPFRGPINDFTVASATRGEIECRLLDGDLGGARVLIELSDSYYQTTGFLVDLEHRAAAQARLAEIYYAQEHYKKAGEVAEVSLQQVQSLRRFLDADAFQRSANPQTMRRAAAVKTLAAIAEGSPELAFEAAERYQLQFAQDLLGSRVKDEAWRNDLATEDVLLLEREGWYKAELEKATAARDVARMDWMQARLDEIQARVKRIVPAQALTPAAKLSYTPQSLSSITDLQDQFPQDVNVLYLLTGKAATAALLFSKGEVKATDLPGATEAVVQQALLALRGAEGTAALDTLKTSLLDPLRDSLPKSGTLVLVGDQLTSLLPLRALDPANEALPATLRICSAPSATTYMQIARARANAGAATIAGLDPATGDFATALTTATAGGGLLLSASIDLTTEDPTLALWSATGAEPAATMLTAGLLPLDIPHRLLALNFDITPGSDALTQHHFAALAESAWRSGAGAIILNQWPVAPEVREKFFKTLGDNLASLEPIEAFQLAQEAIHAEHPDTQDWAAFTYLGAP